MVLLRRRLRCHYCNTLSPDSVSDIPRLYLCRHCDAVNHFDERGNITDPPLEEIATAPAASFRYIQSRSPSPSMAPPTEDLFCHTCQHNQFILNKMLAEYIPDEDDPEYDKRVETSDAYRDELEDRYPQVCQRCEGRVQDQLRAAGYAAKADHLRRMMEKSNQKRTTVQTPRQTWTLAVIELAKWTYIASIFVGVLWHALGIMMAPDERMSADEDFDWDVCLRQAVFVRQVDRGCVLSPAVTEIMYYALAADLLTVWWNPKLTTKTNSLTGRMRGLKSLWAIRAAVLLLRFLCLDFWHLTTINNAAHIFMLILLPLSALLTWKAVRIVYHTPTFFRPAPPSAEKAPRPPASQPTPFDMAHSFTSSFQPNDPDALPPSPTDSETSATTYATDFTTPGRRTPARHTPARQPSYGEDMDWTPTTRRFAHDAPPILPPQFGNKPALSSPAKQQREREQHSIFSKPDPNPFRHKVPAPPNAAKPTPWKPGVWTPPLKENAPNFFKEGHRARGGEGEGEGLGKGLEGLGVPRNVQRDAELFASPKLKYDNYGTPRNTGLESSFNDLFSK
ncbi:hypothetical protein P153DRAFT_424437 [Dothidotthia symphoricarpi CBS 119687]|uniref:Ima1 N-terminal domain-containing protein n=1 Tax=Dothidotthia symphoricarpi CBS 119687 TaxID=1392245 RepID=A0A6A6A5E6_9PLEO|nr:uncharacterized protein P153DRAFT_424437 [Dothidotthia symphoricarpi CBS 119687]KAF2127119.1 hypothetical protein P153DRAFT_424437 [Dothidotthia symphoricarpi CBS 119687]